MLKKIKYKFFYILTIILFILILTNCSIKSTKAKLFSLQGYIAWQQNNWNKSTIKFYQSLNEGEKINNSDIINYSNYNLASTYLMQNEYESANKKLNLIKNTNSNNLLSSIFYQKGIMEFKNKNYQEATILFRKSIEHNSNFLDAKINYEISRKYLNSNTTQNTKKIKNKSTNKEEDINPSILNLIKKKEAEKCNKNYQPQKEKNINDY